MENMTGRNALPIAQNPNVQAGTRPRQSRAVTNVTADMGLPTSLRATMTADVRNMIGPATKKQNAHRNCAGSMMVL